METKIKYYGIVRAELNDYRNEAVISISHVPPRGRTMSDRELQRVVSWAIHDLEEQNYEVVMDGGWFSYEKGSSLAE